MTKAEPTLWLTPQEAADLLGVDLKTIWSFEGAGLIRAIAPRGRGPGKRVWFNRDDLEEFAKTGVAVAARKKK